MLYYYYPHYYYYLSLGTEPKFFSYDRQRFFCWATHIPAFSSPISTSYKVCGFHYVSLAILEITVFIRLASNSQRSTSLFLLSVGVKEVWHHTQPSPIHSWAISFTLEWKNCFGSRRVDIDIFGMYCMPMNFSSKKLICVIWILPQDTALEKLFCMSVCELECMHLHRIIIGTSRGQKRHWIPWNCSYRWLCAVQCDCWELSPSPLQKQPVFLTTKLSF